MKSILLKATLMSSNLCSYFTLAQLLHQAPFHVTGAAKLPLPMDVFVNGTWRTWRWCQTAAVDGPEELKPVDKTHSNTKTPDHADTSKPERQFWIQFVEGMESQCRSRNTGVMWSNFRVLVNKRATAFWTVHRRIHQPEDCWSNTSGC